MYEVIVGAKPFQANDLDELKSVVFSREPFCSRPSRARVCVHV